MNRSILIVICDFIITSMIYLNGGFSAIESPFQDGGGATIDRSAVNVVIDELERQRDALEKERDALLKRNDSFTQNAQQKQQINRLTGELAAVRSKLEFMQRRARLARENAAPLTPAALQKELEEEIRQKNAARAQAEKVLAELSAYKENQLRSDKNLISLRQQYDSLLKELGYRSQSLEQTQNKLSGAVGEVARLNERLTAREAELTRQSRDLGIARRSLAQARGQENAVRQELGRAQNELSFLRGKSDAVEKELAAARDRLLAAEKSVKAREIELAAARTRLENMQNLLKNAVADLTGARAKLAGESAKREQTQSQLDRLKGDYDTVSAKLQNAESRLRSDVLARYSRSAVKLQLSIREKRLLMDRNEAEELYLPLVRINNKNYLVSALGALAGTRKNSSQLSDVIDLKYLASSPLVKEKAPVSRLAGPIMVEKSDCRVALLEVPSSQAQPLTVLTKNALKQRGIHDLYLFKTNSFGKDSTILDSRCSMSFESDDDYLYIRNGVRGSSELKAEVGDLVLTKQGELAAIVVALETYDFGRQQEARCFVFNQLPETDKLPQIKLSKPAGQPDYRDFTDKLNFWLEQAKNLDGRKRRR